MKKLLCLLFVSFLLCSCDKLYDWDFGECESKSGYLDYLPKKTQVGANTFGCYINGELAASKGWYQEEGIKSSLLRNNYVDGFWGIYSGFGSKVDTIMRFDILVKQAFIYMRYVSLHKGIYECEVNIRLRGGQDLSGSAVTAVNITKLDLFNHIISGEFGDLDIPLYKTDSIVHLRKVRFDIKYGADF